MYLASLGTPAPISPRMAGELICKGLGDFSPATMESMDDLTWKMVLAVLFSVLLAGISMGCWLHRACCGNAPGKAPVIQSRCVACQAPTTYTALRGVTTPRFLPLPDASWG